MIAALQVVRIILLIWMIARWKKSALFPLVGLFVVHVIWWALEPASTLQAFAVGAWTLIALDEIRYQRARRRKRLS